MLTGNPTTDRATLLNLHRLELRCMARAQAAGDLPAVERTRCAAARYLRLAEGLVR